MRQLGAGTIVHHGGRGYKVLAHYRSTPRYPGYIITDCGAYLWDREVKVTFFVPTRVDLPPPTRKKKPFFESLLKKMQRG